MPQASLYAWELRVAAQVVSSVTERPRPLPPYPRLARRRSQAAQKVLLSESQFDALGAGLVAIEAAADCHQLNWHGRTHAEVPFNTVSEVDG